ncbi:uncharacterized protein [Amphiura filiformis]|uniref:uncharacterized protein isoform X2 n=1 Tax=Amphiura filiformis TaxID=82378 RepID=UPI003B222D12
MEQSSSNENENAASSDSIDCRIVKVWTLTDEAMEVDDIETGLDQNQPNMESGDRELITQAESSMHQQVDQEGGDHDSGTAIDLEIEQSDEAAPAEIVASQSVIEANSVSQQHVDVEEVSQDSEAASNSTSQEPVVPDGDAVLQQDVTQDTSEDTASNINVHDMYTGEMGTEPSTSSQQIDAEETSQENIPSTSNLPIISEEEQSEQDVNHTSTLSEVAAVDVAENQTSARGASPDQNTTDDDMTLDLVTCHICLSEINTPKSLPCLHTFCRSCLTSWAEKCPNTLTCPTCQEAYPVPPEGIEGLKGNFFVSKLKDRRALKRKLSSPEKIVCSACNSNAEANSRCIDCNDFLCARCTEMHQTIRVLKSHQVVNVAELRSGKVNLFKHPKQQQEQCKKHIGQIVWFYCETCGILICRDCTVVDHCRPEHHYVNVQDAIRGQRQNIQGLTDDCKKILADVEKEMGLVKNHENQLARVVKQASDAVDTAADRAVADLQVCIEAKRNDHQAHIQNIYEERKLSINAHKEKLVSLTSRLKTALDMGKQVSENGSEFEVASTFHSLLTTLKQLKEAKLPVMRKDISRLSFETNEGPLFTIHELGSINTYSTWKVVSRFGRGIDGAKSITKAWAVAIAKNGIAVANNSSSGNVSVHQHHPPHDLLSTLETSKGLGRNPSGWKSFPRGVAATGNNHFFVTDNTMFVKEYNGSGRYVQQFAAVHPNGEATDTMKITLDSVAVDSNDNLLIGPNQHKFISIHKSNSNHVRSFPVTIEPHFIAASRQDDKIVLSSHISNTVHIVSGQGTTLHVLAVDDLPVWRPRGLCCTEHGEVFISNAVKDRTGGSPGIYKFDMTGHFLGCVTKDVTVPYGLALSEDERVLAVGDKKLVTLFELR